MRRVQVEDDEGSILIALLGILIMTAIVTAGLVQIVVGNVVARHDHDFVMSLNAAETGLDKLLTQVRAAPYATSFAPVTATDAAHHSSYTATASGGSGHWTLTASGTSGTQRPVQRTISQHVDVQDLLANALFATTSLTLGGAAGASGVDRYDSAMSSAVCAADGSAQSMTYSAARMCTHATPALGTLGTNGPLTMVGGSLSNVSGVDIYNTGIAGYPNPLSTGRCVNDATTCAAVGGAVTLHEDPLSLPLSSQCANGVGAGAVAYDGSLALAGNAVYSFTDVTLNATAIANLGNLSGSTLVICFSGELNVVPTVPLNSVIQTAVPLRLAPRAPSTLILISTSGSPTVKLNAGLPLSSSLSAVVYAPNATCSATGHVDVYGVLVCATVTAPAGINVHYDTQLGTLPFDQPVVVSKWHE